MDADFSHDPADLPRLYSACHDEGYDLAIGSRYVSGVNVVNWPMGRVLMRYFAISSILSGIFGTTTCTSYLESAAGVAEGGRTGITSFTTAICFILAIFASPIFLAIPGVVTGAIMLIVSFHMFSAIRHINLSNPVEAIPSVLIILMMTITGSISDGIVGWSTHDETLVAENVAQDVTVVSLRDIIHHDVFRQLSLGAELL